MKTPLQLVKGDKSGDTTDYRDALAVNMIPIVRPVMGSKGYMIQYPGLTKYGDGVWIDRRGIWNERQKNHYRVSGEKFISVSRDGVPTELGDIPGADTASLPYSFDTQGIIANKKFWLYDPGSGLVQVTDPDVGFPIDGVWVDGYYFLTDGEFIYHTDLDDESSIDPLKFSTAAFMPDESIGVAKTPDNKVMVFGRYSIEYFVNVATTAFAFQRIATRALKAGIVGTHAKVEVDGVWYILGGSKEAVISIYAVGVGSVVQVASREIDKLIAEYTEEELASVVLDSYTDDGNSYLLVHLPMETLVFSITFSTQFGKDPAWTIIKSDTAGDDQWRAKFIMFEPRLGKLVTGDKLSGTLGIFDNTVGTQYEAIAEWLLFTPFVYLDSQSVDALDLQILPGHNVTDDATVFLSMTYDGVIWGKEWTMQYGVPGVYDTRFIAYRLGYVREWVGYKLRGATRSRMAFARALIEHG